MSGVGCPLDIKNGVEISRRGWCGGCDPFRDCAVVDNTVVVDVGGPSRSDLETIIAVGGKSRDQRPVAVLCVHENRASVVANAVPQAVVNPCLDHITIVQTSDGRRNKTTQTDVLGCREAGQVEPGLVELDLLGCITVGCVVQCLVREGVGDMGKGVAVGGRLPPDQQRVVLGAI